MKMSQELHEKVKSLFADNDEVREKLLALDADTIRNIGSMSQIGIDPQDVVTTYEKSNSKEPLMEKLYDESKKILELQELYEKLYLAYYTKAETQELPKELQEKINSLFADNDEVRTKLLALDADTIRNIGSFSQINIDPSDIANIYENSNDNETKELYNKAKRLLELQELYKKLCIEFYKNSRDDREER